MPVRSAPAGEFAGPPWRPSVEQALATCSSYQVLLIGPLSDLPNLGVVNLDFVDRQLWFLITLSVRADSQKGRWVGEGH